MLLNIVVVPTTPAKVSVQLVDAAEQLTTHRANLPPYAPQFVCTSIDEAA